MILSLTLGFVIFLNIVARIPFATDYHDALKHTGFSNIKIGRMSLEVPTCNTNKYLIYGSKYNLVVLMEVGVCLEFGLELNEAITDALFWTPLL